MQSGETGFTASMFFGDFPQPQSWPGGLGDLPAPVWPDIPIAETAAAPEAVERFEEEELESEEELEPPESEFGSIDPAPGP